MLSKKNEKERIKDNCIQNRRFSIRKLTIGAASVAIGCTLMGFATNKPVQAAQVEKTASVATTPTATKLNNIQKDNVVTEKANTKKGTTQTEQVHPVAKEQAAPVTNLASTNETKQSESTQSTTQPTANEPATVTDAPNYPNTNGMVPESQYIFAQFNLTNGSVTNGNYTPLNLLITLATSRKTPQQELYCYITSKDYSKMYFSPEKNSPIAVNQKINFTTPDFAGSNIQITNFGSEGVSLVESNNAYGLAFTFGYGKYQSMIHSQYPNPYSENNVSNAWGDSVPEHVTQTISYIDEKTGKEMPNTQPYVQEGLTGQHYQVNQLDKKVIKGYYLVNAQNASGTLSQFHNGGTYQYKWISQVGDVVEETWHQISNDGKMKATIVINGQTVTDPKDPEGIVYPPSDKANPNEPTVLNIGSYSFPNPYVTQTTNIELKYAPLGKIVPVDPEGNPIPDAPTPQYQNNPDNPTTVQPDEPVPEIPGYTPEVKTVTPNDPGSDTKVVYVKNKEYEGTQTVKFVNEEGKELSPSDVQEAKFTGSHTFGKITVPVIKGYIATKNTAGGLTVTESNPNAEQTIVYKKIGSIVPVDPEGNPIPDAPTPPYENDPNDPTKVVPNEPVPSIPGYTPETPSVTPDDPTKDTKVVYEKNKEYEGTQTVKFVNEEGKELSPSDVQKTKFTGSHTFGKVTVPVIKGYIATKNTAGGLTVTESDPNAEQTIVYKKIGSIVPVDPEGNPIPDPSNPSTNVPDKPYENDPNDPTKVVPNEPVPSIPGYTPETPSVTPDDPTKDTKVVYEKDKSEKGSVTIIVHDETTNKDLKQYGYSSGQEKTGTTVDYNWDKIKKELTDKGYQIVTPNVVIPSTIAKGDKTITINVKSPQEPTPTPTPTPVEYNGSQTIRFVNEEGKEISPSNVQGITFTGSYTFGKVKVPVIKGYVATQNTAGGLTVTESNPNVVQTIVYKKIGSIVPVDPEGNPIPDVPTPPYENDPNDPTKVVPNEPVPSIPGYTPEIPTVTPDDPAENTPVVYRPDKPTKDDETPNKPEKPDHNAIPNVHGENVKNGISQNKFSPMGVKSSSKSELIKTNAIPRNQRAKDSNQLPQTGKREGLALIGTTIGMLSVTLGIIASLAVIRKHK